MPDPHFEFETMTANLLDGWRRRDQLNQRAVIFVHGFMGNPATTWKAPEAAESFPELLKGDEGFSDFDFFRFQYRSSPFSGPSIKNIAQQLENEIVGPLAGYRLVLLAHSMGGLVCMQYILNRLGRGENLPILGLLMFGTPTTGVEWLNVARIVLELGGLRATVVKLLKSLLGGNAQYKEISAASDFLQELHEAWTLRVVNGGFPREPASRRASIPVRVVTGNEDWVVKEYSAKGIYGQIDWHPVQLDHLALVKPSQRNHVCYQRAADFLTRYRYSHAADVLEGLRDLSDWVWEQRHVKLIRDWSFEIRFREADQEISGSSLQLEGFKICEVKCRYKLFLGDKPFAFGLTLGGDAARTAWRENPAYLHQIFPGALTAAERESTLKAIRARLADGTEAWQNLFENVFLRIAESGSTSWHNLVRQEVESSEDYLLTSFSLPEGARHLVGREVTLDLGFRSLRPGGLNEFTLQFPWLTAGFDALIAVYGGTEYLTASPQMFGPTLPQIDAPEEFGGGKKIRITAEEQLVLPGSSVRIEWLPAF